MGSDAGEPLPAAADEGMELGDQLDRAGVAAIVSGGGNTPASSSAGSEGHVPDVDEELQQLRLERQPSTASTADTSRSGSGGQGGSPGGHALFAGQDTEDEAALAPAPLTTASVAAATDDASVADQQQQLERLRNAQAQVQVAASGTGSPHAGAGSAVAGAPAAVAGGGSPSPSSSSSSSSSAAQAEEAESQQQQQQQQLSAHPKHVFVFSTAGKPIFSHRGDEAALAGLMATAEAILSVAHSKGHTLKHVRVGSQVFAFLERPPLCLVGVSALAEPPAVLRMQLVLVHGQIISLLTSAALQALFARNPGYDARHLLGGSDGMLSTLIDSFTSSPATLLGAYPSLPLLGGVRQALATALTAAIKATGALHGLVVAAGQVAAACPAAGASPLQQWDLLLLLNLLGANPSFRHSGEAMTPVCLPRFNPAANLHAYISYADASTQTATVLLCGGMPDPAALSAAARRMQVQLEAIGALQALVQCAAQEDHLSSANGSSRGGSSSSAGDSRSRSESGSGGSIGASAGGGSSGRLGAGGPGGGPPCGAALLAVPSLPPAAGGGRFGTTPLLHFIYKHSGRQQFVMSPFGRPLLEAGLQQPLVVAYSQLRAAMFESSTASSGPLQRLRFEARPRFVLFGAASGETELYLACDPLTEKGEAAGVASRLGMWLHARHDQLFNLL